MFIQLDGCKGSTFSPIFHIMMGSFSQNTAVVVFLVSANLRTFAAKKVA